MIEVAVGMLIAWVVAKARRVAVRADGMVDKALDAAVDRVGGLVLTKLGADSAVERLQLEAAQPAGVSDRTRDRVKLALEDAVDSDPDFATQLKSAVGQATSAGASTTALLEGGVHATDSSVAFGQIFGGTFNLNQAPPTPPEPGRA